MSYHSRLNGYDFEHVIRKFFKICDGLYGKNNPYRFPTVAAYESAIREWQISLSTLPEEQITNCENFGKWFYRYEAFSKKPPTFWEFSNCNNYW